MKYALLIYASENGGAPEPEIMAEYRAISDAANTVGGAQLQPSGTATTVRVANGDTLTTDGPFSETKEVLGGFFLIEAGDLDEALAVAARVPAARSGGAVEVRPLVEM